MKKLKFVLGLAGIFTVMMLSSCSNLDPFGKDTQNSNEKNYVSFTINTSPSGRFIAADSSYDSHIQQITDWTLVYTNENDANTITWQEGSTSTDSSTTYLTKENDNLKVCNFPVGKYTFELTGIYTFEDEDSAGFYQFYGKATDVEIVSGKTNSISIIVGSKRTEEGSGSLILTFNGLFSDNNNYEGLSISLVNLTKKDAEKIDLYSSDYSITENLELKINKNNIPSGLYKIEITYTGYKISIDNGDCFVEIADSVTTTKSGITLSCETNKIFYATNKESSYNGLAPVSPKNLTRLLLLNNIVYVKEKNISIYMGDESPEIDIAVVNSLAEKQLGKTIDIYKGTPASEKKCLSISDSGIDISGELTLIPNVDKELKVNLITVNQEDASAYTITLKDGASLNIENANLSNALTIAAIDSTTEKDNFLAYMETPFITVKTDTDISDKLKLSYVEENATQYTILPQVSADKTTYSYTLKLSSFSDEAGLNVQSHTDAKITAQYQNDDTDYTIGENVEIPYTNATLTFSLSGIQNSENITWYLNGKIFSAGSFNPYSNSEVKIDNYNTVTCLFSVDGEYFISEFEFILGSIKTTTTRTAVYGYNNSDYGHVRLAYVSDYTDTSAKDVTIKDGESEGTDFKWCLDENSNLWVLWDKVLYKYELNSSDNGYEYSTTSSTGNNLSMLLDSSEIKDISYDVKNKYIFILSVNSSENYTSVMAIPTDESQGSYYLFQLQENNYILNQIAVYGNDIYVSDNSNDCIVKISFELNNGQATAGTPEVFYSSISTDFSDSTTALKITDLQIGDGYGNNTDTLFAIVRDIDSDSPQTTYYSRGGLVSISTVNKDSIVYGYSNSNYTTVTGTDSGSDVKYNLYSPAGSSETGFFGPTHFCAVVPKKLVILDDGYILSANDSGRISVSKKDGFMEFDIAGKSLKKCSENINAFEYEDIGKSIFASTFDITDYYGYQ